MCLSYIISAFIARKKWCLCIVSADSENYYYSNLILFLFYFLYQTSTSIPILNWNLYISAEYDNHFNIFNFTSIGIGIKIIVIFWTFSPSFQVRGVYEVILNWCVQIFGFQSIHQSENNWTVIRFLLALCLVVNLYNVGNCKVIV